MYELILARGWPAHKVVMGVLTNSENGNGWVPWDILADTVPALADRNPGFGGVAGWEYFNALPGGREKPWEWTMFMTALLGDQDASAAAEAAAAAEREPAKPVPAASRPGEAAGAAAEQAVDVDADPSSGPEAPVPKAFEYESDGTRGD